ncbi:MAG: LacI family transcriptional regulator [Kiritimatiellia bacterium]|jgi:LacI family transcriptional regulator
MGTTKGKSRGNIYEVAEKAGVSFVTVSRVFNDHPNVSDAMRDRVFEAARNVGYSPKLVSKPTVLAIVIDNHERITTPGFTQRLLMHMVRFAAARNYFIEFLTLDNLETATKRLVDGMIAVGLNEKQMQSLVRLPNVPVIQTNFKTVNDHWNTIACDYYQETRAALEHFQQGGHQQVALVLGSQADADSKERMRAYEDVFEGQRRTISSGIFDLDSQAPDHIAAQIRHGGFTACAILTDATAQVLLSQLCRFQGMRVPDDLSIITIEEPGVSAFQHPPMTTMEAPVAEMAELAVSGLIELIKGAEITPRSVFPSTLNLRKSTVPLPVT